MSGRLIPGYDVTAWCQMRNLRGTELYLLTVLWTCAVVPARPYSPDVLAAAAAAIRAAVAADPHCPHTDDHIASPTASAAALFGLSTRTSGAEALSEVPLNPPPRGSACPRPLDYCAAGSRSSVADRLAPCLAVRRQVTQGDPSPTAHMLL